MFKKVILALALAVCVNAGTIRVPMKKVSVPTHPAPTLLAHASVNPADRPTSLGI